MTRDEFRNAIRKGQGRVIQCLRSSAGEQYIDIIEHACTHHLSYDAQCEGGREEYMTEIVGYVGGLQRFRQSIIEALRTTDEYYDSSQLFGLARRLAVAGDAEARDTMYSRFDASVRARQHIAGALDIIELDGADGLRVVATCFGRECEKDAEYWPDDVRWFTNEKFAEGQIEAALSEMAQSDLQVRAYLDRLRAEKSSGSQSPSRPSNNELERMSFDDLMSHASLGSAIVGPFMMQRWGKSATEADIRKAAYALENATDPAMLKLLVGVFRWRPFSRSRDAPETLEHALC